MLRPAVLFPVGAFALFAIHPALPATLLFAFASAVWAWDRYLTDQGALEEKRGEAARQLDQAAAKIEGFERRIQTLEATVVMRRVG